MEPNKDNILSFCIFDDLQPAYGPIHVQFQEKSYKVLTKIVDNIIRECTNDPSGYYVNKHHSTDEVVATLISDDYYVINRYQKYYVIAFAINYTRFEIYSKDCDKELIQWREDD